MHDLLYTVFTRIEAAYEEEFARWQEQEHCPYLLTLPGYYSVTRYASLDRPHVYANFWHIAGKEFFDNPQRKVRAETPWGLRLSPFRHRRIDFFQPDPLDGADGPPPAEVNPRLRHLVIDQYACLPGMEGSWPALCQGLLYKSKQRPEVLDTRLYRPLEEQDRDTCYALYYLCASEAGMDREFLPWLTRESAALHRDVHRGRYRCIGQWDGKKTYPVSFGLTQQA